MGVNRMPMLATAGIHTFFNGPESFTPDDRYYLGEAPELARLLGGGRLQLDRHRLVRRRRHGAGAVDRTTASRPSTSGRSTSAARSRSRRTAATSRSASPRRSACSMPTISPTARWRPRAASAARRCTSTCKARGAVFGEVAGWERANWFASDGQEREYRYSWKRQNWFDNQRDEHLAVRNGVGLFDMTSFGKIRVEGRDALRLPAAALRQRHRRAGRAASSTRRC